MKQQDKNVIHGIKNNVINQLIIPRNYLNKLFT